MSVTRAALEAAHSRIAESMGVRESAAAPATAPRPPDRDRGRRPSLTVAHVDIDLVTPDPEQPREDFDEAAVRRLADSLREQGQLAPIRVRWSESLLKYAIVFGERRWRAAKLAGLQTIECSFEEGDPGPGEVLVTQLVENCLRRDLHPLEEARAFARLIELQGWTGKQLAERLCLPASTVTRRLALLKLPDELQRRVASGELGGRAAYELSKVVDADEQLRLADRIQRQQLTNVEAADTVRNASAARGRRRRSLRIPFSPAPGWKVVVTAKQPAGYDEVVAVLQRVLEEASGRRDSGRRAF